MSSMRIPAERIKRDFAKHKAEILLEQTLSDDTKMTVIKFAEPGTGVGHMRFTIYSNYLTVQGDYGSAVYRWSSTISLPFLAGCDFGYFLEKCEASENGRRFEEWDDNAVIKFIEDELKSMAKENDCLRAYHENVSQLRGSVHSMDEWRNGIEDLKSEDRHRLFGDEWYEYIGVGMVPSIRAELHWNGIKKAQEYLTKETVSE